MRYKILLFLTIISQVTFGQNSNRNYSKPFLFVDSLLSKETYIAEFLDFQYPQEIQEILILFQQSMSENKEWSEAYIPNTINQGKAYLTTKNLVLVGKIIKKSKTLINCHLQ